MSSHPTYAVYCMLLSWVALCLLFIMLPVVCAAEKPDNLIAEVGKDSVYQSVYDFVVGQPAQNSIYLGMWSHHFIDADDGYTNTHNLIGMAYSGFYFGTFLNSYEDRAWAVGLQRDVYSTTLGVFSVKVGYRLGLMYGYEDLQFSDTGLFPLFQLYADMCYKRLGVQASWAGSVFTAGFFIRF